ncbi:MAG: TetR/AcrR family transcriptional regulator [Kineosporiaceae bacterium]
MDEREPKPTSPGRPRSAPRQRAGSSGREEILDAAAELFSMHGYAATSTRAIAAAVGIKQASLYYHFPSKEQILSELLSGTVQPSRSFADWLAESGRPHDVQLWALVHFDVQLLCQGPWNIAALYLMPELRSPRFAEFRQDRARLKAEYARRIGDARSAGLLAVADEGIGTELVFAMVESTVSLRGELDHERLATLPDLLADGALRLLRCPEPRLREVRLDAVGLHAAYTAEAGGTLAGAETARVIDVVDASPAPIL